MEFTILSERAIFSEFRLIQSLGVRNSICSWYIVPFIYKNRPIFSYLILIW